MAENIIQASDRSVSEVIEECLSSATALGMDLSYSPSVLLEDIRHGSVLQSFRSSGGHQHTVH